MFWFKNNLLIWLILEYQDNLNLKVKHVLDLMNLILFFLKIIKIKYVKRLFTKVVLNSKIVKNQVFLLQKLMILKFNFLMKNKNYKVIFIIYNQDNLWILIKVIINGNVNLK